jgi:hypothetical protein
VVNFTPRPFNPQGKSPWYPLDRRLGGPLSWSGHGESEGGFSCAFLTKHHTVKAYGGGEVWFHTFLTSAFDGGEWSVSRPGRFTSRERAPGTHSVGGWVGGWAGLRTGLDTRVKRKIPSPFSDSNPRSTSL